MISDADALTTPNPVEWRFLCNWLCVFLSRVSNAFFAPFFLPFQNPRTRLVVVMHFLVFVGGDVPILLTNIAVGLCNIANGEKSWRIWGSRCSLENWGYKMAKQSSISNVRALSGWSSHEFCIDFHSNCAWVTTYREVQVFDVLNKKFVPAINFSSCMECLSMRQVWARFSAKCTSKAVRECKNQVHVLHGVAITQDSLKLVCKYGIIHCLWSVGNVKLRLQRRAEARAEVEARKATAEAERESKRRRQQVTAGINIIKVLVATF